MSSLFRVESVDAVNRMTRQWVRNRTDESSAFCAPSAWPLLALLAHAAEGRGRGELEQAVGLPAADGRAAALEILSLLREMAAVRAAAGIWAQQECRLDPAWTSGLPLDAIGRLTGDSAADQAALDAWARQQTDGLIERMPIEVDAGTLFVLAAAMSVRTSWVRPFEDWGSRFQPETGPWRHGSYFLLSRSSANLDPVTVSSTDHGEITCLEIPGQDGITVHLVIGEPGRCAREVLDGGLTARTGHGREGHRPREGSELPVGSTAPGLVVERVRANDPDDVLWIRTPRFRVDSEHDLLEQPEVFGLDAVTDGRRGHFPALGPVPLAVSQARQRATARFTAKGFEAAAVTAVSMLLGSAPPVPTQTVKQIRVELDRPFGYLATHHGSGLILAAGWVAEPEGFEPADEEP
jgi:serine protease inhibitor